MCLNSEILYKMIKKSLWTCWFQYKSFLPYYLAQSDCLAAYRQRDTRLTITPFVIPNSNYVIMVSDSNYLKYFCVFLYCNHQVPQRFLIILYVCEFYSPRLNSSGQRQWNGRARGTCGREKKAYSGLVSKSAGMMQPWRPRLRWKKILPWVL
jgi:hypothetical protein